MNEWYMSAWIECLTDITGLTYLIKLKLKQQFDFQEILERMQYAMINEGFKVLDEGICTRPEEIDVIW